MTPENLATLHALCFANPRPWSADEFTSLLGSFGTFLLSAPSGFILGRTVADEAELLTLAVHPDAQRQGAGRALLRDYHAAARSNGAVHGFLEVAADNAAAIALYQSEGYTESGRRPGYYAAKNGEKIDAIVMVTSLS